MNIHTRKNKTKNKSKQHKTKKYQYQYQLSKRITGGLLPVSKLHSIAYSCYGNRKGKPLLIVHGGPGGSLTVDMTRNFNPKKYFIVIADQRGCGKSTPFGELKENTTHHLVDDFEKLRKHLKVKTWTLSGGSWGSTLSLVYAIKHPDIIKKMFISGIFLGNDEEVIKVQEGIGSKLFFPEEYETYKNFIPKKERSNLRKAYMKRFQGKYGKTVKNNAYMNWALWENTINSVTRKSKKTMKNKLKKNDIYKTSSMIECHYFLNDCFLSKNYILKNINKIKHIPTYIVQGHFDLVCYPIYAYRLHKALPNSKLFLTNGGHSNLDEINKKTKYDVMKKYD